MPPLVSGLPVVEAGIKAACAHTLTPRKAPTLHRAGEMGRSSLSHPEPKSVSNGMSVPSASPITAPLITSAPSALLRITLSSPENVSNYKKIVTPLCADGFDILLRRYNLMSRYPNLSWNLHNGFPLGEFDYLRESFIHPNHSTSDAVNNYILKYIQDEVADGRMSGPFTWVELKKEARGEVIVSPLGAVDKAGEPGKLHIIRDLSFKGKAPFSVNDKIDPDSYITKWTMAAMIIDLVSLIFFYYHYWSLLSVLRHCKCLRFLAFAPARAFRHTFMCAKHVHLIPSFCVVTAHIRSIHPSVSHFAPCKPPSTSQVAPISLFC
jgi:hypothetical protein